ncbi:PQQ-binding-like beta-propeller repeat protein [Bradyrhizobium sp. 149]|uniref:outer membrane protein assembly factor BamB family protein n=1 Tax=Bradyrhizobium sp. 149 TaxID=2782624 RepID=UPI001FF9F7D5|nr:PQQ-binding-like beta-propeller repeat protein [Bradyrhizobium sp. 149]
MFRFIAALITLPLCALAVGGPAQAIDFKPVTSETLADPDPADWLMINRTYDEQRFSPLNQINRSNVGELRVAWVRGLPQGTQESTPLVHQGVIYLIAPGGGVQALDGSNGDLIWEYWRTYPKDMLKTIPPASFSRSKNLAIFEDLIYFAAPDGYLVALDARSGKVRWETKAHDYADGTEHTGGLMVADGKLISNRACRIRAGCFLAAHDAGSGKELWRFYTTPASEEPGADSWGNLPDQQRVASSWGLPGSYDPKRRITYWAIANPTPYTRLKRHGSTDAVSFTAPSELYSNSTVALDVDTGKLSWYYQHLPGDDWDSDHIHERTLLRTKVSPDPKFVKWINPTLPKGEEHDVVVEVAEAGDIFVLDRESGRFLWAQPFPLDMPHHTLQSIDVATGRTQINVDAMLGKDGDRSIICSFNTRSWWATSYDPGRNALYVPFQDACLDMTANNKSPTGAGPRTGIRRPGVDENAYAGIMKIDLATGEMTRILSQAWPGNGSALATGGDLLFWGDLNRRLHAIDSDSGKVLWEIPLGGMIVASTISYAIDGKQYIAVLTGDGLTGTANVLADVPKLKTVRGHSAIYVFALPDKG